MNFPLAPIAPIGAPPMPEPALQAKPAASFGQMLLQGIDAANQKVIDANTQVRAFTLDDSVPVHQVTYALSQAQLSMELMLQVRSRMVEGYQQLMNMQL
ncbi:MAG TPA: flagellar hook-basal body complex protein FliE [Rhizomicrobium sp.]|nr:flagellar hook-basal body complex protein FliE [Rhizomicrobium sp.]